MVNNRIGFVSTRLAGTDGVSLEVGKWVKVLDVLGRESFFFAGESEWPQDRSYVVPEAHFAHPDILHLTDTLFGVHRRSPEISQKVQWLKDHLKAHLYRFMQQFEVETLIVENALSIPMNIPLGLALAEFIAETCCPTIAHHHDFSWERERFLVNAADDYLRAAFPPTLHSIRHVVINSFAGQQLALRTGADITLIPNVMDFDSSPPPPDAITAQLRSTLNISEEEHLLLQPTRVVPRKRIELAINLTRKIDLPCTLVVTHDTGDEGDEYLTFLNDYAQTLGVRVLFAAHQFNHARKHTADGQQVFALADIYHCADLVTYPSRIEGFGNAFLEAVYYRRPLVMSTYEIFRADIEPRGFKVIEFGDYIGSGTIQHARSILLDPAQTAAMVDRNFELGRQYYSYKVLEKQLAALIGLSS